MNSRITAPAVAALTLLLVGATPSVAARKCAAFEPRLQTSQSGLHEEGNREDVVVVKDTATEEKPLTFAYTHGPGLDLGATYDVIVPDAKFFNLQVRSKKQNPQLNLRIEWPAPSPQDVDMYLYNSRGNEAAASASFNAVPEIHNDDDGNGWEQIVDFPVSNCSGFTLESQGGITVNVQATLKVWLD